MRCRIVVFRDGRRLERRYDDHHDAASLVKQLKAKGVRYRLVTSRVLPQFQYPPIHDDLSSRNGGKLWCPYCREWSYFRVPKYTPHAEVGSDSWFLNACHRQGLKVCAWCHISQLEFSVKLANGLWSEQPKRRRRKRR